MSVAISVAAVEEILKWTFTRKELLIEALTHSTFANENETAGPDNERLEFLGDAVVDLLVSRMLYEAQGNAPEGEMSRHRARVVRREGLAALAEQMQVGQYLRLGQGQRKTEVGGGLLADLYEALVGAVFLDGGYSAAQECFAAGLQERLQAATQPLDFKTQLQEHCHRLRHNGPLYHVVSVDGPDHARVYTCEVVLEDVVCGRGEGRSKKSAEQECARIALENVAEPDNA